MLEHINNKKRQKILKFKNLDDKIRSLIGEILIRTLISQKFNIPNYKIDIKENQFGKPFLNNKKNFKFNISHSDEYVICAIDKNNIGIDIELVKPLDYKNIAKNFFTRDEYNYITSLNSLNRFYEIWTRKESYVKAIGKGLYINLDSFNVNLRKNIHGVMKIKEYYIKEYNLDYNFKISVCSPNDNFPTIMIEIDLNELINNFFKINNIQLK